jgi:uncharacterized membrane protein
MSDYSVHSAAEDRTMPAVVYGLYLLTFATGLTAIIGVIIAHAQRSVAGPVMNSHYEFQIRTFWLGLAACILNGILMGVGFVLSFILIGIPIVAFAGLVYAALGVWFGLRSILGIVYLCRGEAYPRPYALLA